MNDEVLANLRVSGVGLGATDSGDESHDLKSK